MVPELVANGPVINNRRSCGQWSYPVVRLGEVLWSGGSDRVRLQRLCMRSPNQVKSDDNFRGEEDI